MMIQKMMIKRNKGDRFILSQHPKIHHNTTNVQMEEIENEEKNKEEVKKGEEEKEK